VLSLVGAQMWFSQIFVNIMLYFFSNTTRVTTTCLRVDAIAELAEDKLYILVYNYSAWLLSTTTTKLVFYDCKI